MVDQLGAFASEVTRVAREVGTEGKLGGQAEVAGVSGTWKDLTDNVNSMASNLTSQVRNIAEVTTAVANGDLSKKITVNVKGEILDLKDTINMMVDQLNAFASEVTRVAREVGTEGQLGGQAEVRGVAGTWKDLTDSVNHMASNLTSQVRNIAAVTTAVAKGDLSKKITVDVRGEMLDLKDTINTMVDQLNAFASEVTRVAREVGTEGKLGGQAEVAGRLRHVEGPDRQRQPHGRQPHQPGAQHRRRHDRRRERRPVEEDHGGRARRDPGAEEHHQHDGGPAQRASRREVTRVAREVGTEGQLGGQAQVRGVSGTWKDLTDNVNFMASNLTNQVRNIAAVTTAVANGDLSKKITVDVKGEILELKDTINTMVDQLNAFASEVTRVAREVGTEGKLGGQADVKGVAGTWKNLTDNVNSMAANLTSQVRGIAKVVTAVAQRRPEAEARVRRQGRDRRAGRHDQRDDRHARDVRRAGDDAWPARWASKGKLGGQANVPGRGGHVARPDRQRQPPRRQPHDAGARHRRSRDGRHQGRPVALDRASKPQGEVAALKDNINEMIRNLQGHDADQHRAGLAEDEPRQVHPHAPGPARPARRRAADPVGARAARERPAGAVLRQRKPDGGEADLQLLASYAHRERKRVNARIKEGEGLVGQVAFEKERILLTDVPDDYIVRTMKISSGLGEATPRNIVVLPVLFEKQVKAVIELASFKAVQRDPPDVPRPAHREHRHRAQHARREHAHRGAAQAVAVAHAGAAAPAAGAPGDEPAARGAGPVAARVGAAAEGAAGEAHGQQRRAGGKGHGCWREQNAEVARKNNEIELARQELEEKAEQLALSSQVQERVPGEHEPRAAHAAQQPADPVEAAEPEPRGQPDRRSRSEYAGTIHSAGSDLLALINEILDLAKIESGTMEVDVRNVPFANLKEYVERNFRPLAEQKGLEFAVELAPDLPAGMSTDPQRLQQVLRNLLSNAFKFTDAGSVRPARRAGATRLEPAERGAEPRRGGDRVLRHRHRHRHPADKHRVDLRGVPAGRRHDEPQVRRDGPGLVDQPRDRLAAARRDRRRQRARARAARSRCTCRDEYPTSTACGRVGRRQPQRRPAARPRRAARQPATAAAVPRRPRRNGELGPRNGGRTQRRRPRAGRRASAASAARPLNPTPRSSDPPAPADDRGGHPPRRPRAARHRRRPGLRRDPARTAPQARLQGASSPPTARRASPWPASSSRSAITLDIALPGMNGWAVLDRLKHDPAVRHIPVHILSVTETTASCALQAGRARLPPEAAGRGGRGRACWRDLKAFVERGERQPAGRRGRREPGEQHRRARRRRRRRHRRPPAAARRRWRRCGPGGSTASCWTWGCPGMSGFELLDDDPRRRRAWPACRSSSTPPAT